MAISNDIERLSDHAMNINDEVKILINNNYILSEFATNEITFGQSSIPGVSYQNETNIPLYVIGYKTGLFN